MRASVDRAHDSYLSDALAAAVAGDPGDAGFDVHYRPIVRFEDSSVVGLEARLHWSCPRVGDVDHDVLIALAEREGLMGFLDEFVLGRACGDAHVLARARGRAVDVHVSIRADRLGASSMEEAVARALQQHRLPPTRLVLAITQGSGMVDLDAAVAALDRLRRRGVRIALGAFEPRLASLARMHALPIDIIKLSAVFTDVEADSLLTRALCEWMLALCTEYRWTVIAEEVEAVSQAEVLARLGCRLGQGSLYRLPEPLDRLLARVCREKAQRPRPPD